MSRLPDISGIDRSGVAVIEGSDDIAEQTTEGTHETEHPLVLTASLPSAAEARERIIGSDPAVHAALNVLSGDGRFLTTSSVSVSDIRRALHEAQTRSNPEKLDPALPPNRQVKPASEDDGVHLLELERRVAALESLLGSGGSFGVDPSARVLTALRRLEARATLLEPNTGADLMRRGRLIEKNLETILARFAEVNRTQGEASALPSPGFMKHLETVYEAASAYDAEADVVPLLLTRLGTLKSVLDDADAIKTAALSANDHREDVQRKLREMTEQLSSLESVMAENMTDVQTATSLVASRTGDLLKVIEDLRDQRSD